MIHTNLPIYKKGYDLLSLAADVQLNMHLTFKQSLGKRVHDECVDLLLEIGYANASRVDKRCGLVQFGPRAERRRTSEANWKLLLKWNKEAERLGIRYRVFCASLADVFDNAVPDQWRLDLSKLICSTPNLDWLLLTKRIGNAPSILGDIKTIPLLPNIWLGITVCNQEEADRDIPKLLEIPAAKRFVSIEPMLGCVDLSEIAFLTDENNEIVPYDNRDNGLDTYFDSPESYFPTIDLVICGGETGPKARPMHPDWVRSLRDQCKASCVPFMFKQWG